MEITEIAKLLDSGGTPAVVVMCYFIYKLEARLARIEKAFEIIAQRLDVSVKE